MQTPDEFFKEVTRIIKNPKLYNEYVNKRNSYIEDLGHAKNHVLVEKFFLLTAITDICMEVYGDFLSVTSEVILKLAEQQSAQNELVKQFNNYMESKMETSISGFTTAIESNADESLIDFLKENAEISISVWESHLATSKSVAELVTVQFFIYNSSILCAYSSLLELMKSRDSKTTAEALEVFVKFVIGLIPVVGNLITIQELLETLKERQKRIGDASDILNNLDENYFTLFNWCLFMQIMIDHLNSFVHGGKPVLDQTGEPNETAIDSALEKFKMRFKRYNEKMRNSVKQDKA